MALEIEASLLPVEGGHSRFPQGSMLPPWILFTAPYVAIPDIMSVCVCDCHCSAGMKVWALLGLLFPGWGTVGLLLLPGDGGYLGSLLDLCWYRMGLDHVFSKVFCPSGYFLKVSCFAALSYSWFFGWREKIFLGLYTWILPGSDFFSTHSGICKGKGKFRELITRLASGADTPSHSPSLISSLFSFIKSVL